MAAVRRRHGSNSELWTAPIYTLHRLPWREHMTLQSEVGRASKLSATVRPKPPRGRLVRSASKEAAPVSIASGADRSEYD